MEEKVTVIIPTYNRPRWLPETIESVLAQTYPNVEIIVVNDGSTDNTEQFVEPYMDKVKYIYKENGGPGSAVNAAIRASTGKYISRIDDDDLFLPEKIELQVKMFQQNPEVGLVASDHHIMNAEGKIVYTRTVPEFSGHGAFINLLQQCIFSQPTVMVRRECHDKAGMYREGTYAQDYEMWIRIAKHYPVAVIHKPLAIYRRHGSNRSGRSSNRKVKTDIQNFICDIMDETSMEELLPKVHSIYHAHDVRGAIFSRHELYKRAGGEFYKGVKAEPHDMIHLFWLGIVLRQIGKYEEGIACFRKVPPGDRLYDMSLRAMELTSELQKIDRTQEDEVKNFRRLFSKEFGEIMDITISKATGQLQ